MTKKLIDHQWPPAAVAAVGAGKGLEFTLPPGALLLRITVQTTTAFNGTTPTLAAVSSLVEAQARLYSASASVEQAASAASDHSFELGLSRSRAQMEAGSRNAELMLQQAKFLTDQLLSINDTKLKVGAQLTAASWSAVNYSAGVSDSVGQSTSCSQNFNFNGETSDA